MFDLIHCTFFYYQYLSPYLSADLRLMASSFNTTVNQLEDELMTLILEGQIQARIDSHNKVRVLVHPIICFMSSNQININLSKTKYQLLNKFCHIIGAVLSRCRSTKCNIRACNGDGTSVPKKSANVDSQICHSKE